MKEGPERKGEEGGWEIGNKRLKYEDNGRTNILKEKRREKKKPDLENVEEFWWSVGEVHRSSDIAEGR